MKLSIETIGRVYAAGRNLINQALGVAAGAGAITVAQDKGAMDALDQIGQGVSMVFHGASSLYGIGVVVLGPAIGFVLTWAAQRSAKTENQAKSVVAAVADPNTPITPAAKDAITSAAAKV